VIGIAEIARHRRHRASSGNQNLPQIYADERGSGTLPEMPKLPNIAEIGRCQNHYRTIALVASPCGTI
jgi:hypothetical protein